MILASWDPLEAAAANDQEILSSAKKREIKNILKSYVGTYDPMSELLQNAMDAIDRRIRENPGEVFDPKISVGIDLRQNSFEVVDNGCGFSEAEFRSFMAPNISYKTSRGSRGNKGVGSTYIAYGFNGLVVGSKNALYTFCGNIERGRDWVDDMEGAVPRPQVVPTNPVSEAFAANDQGAIFRIRFGGKNTRPSSLKWYGATTPEQWVYLLLTKTPLGYLSLPSMKASGIKLDLTVVDQDGVKRSLTDVDTRYKFPHQEINASQRIKDITDAQTLAITQGKDPSRVLQRFKNANGVYEIYETGELLKIPALGDDERKLVENFSVTAYGYFAYSTAIWDQLSDVKAGLRRGYRVLRGGLQLANNGMVQGDPITIPLTKSIGHQNQAHIIVHFENAEPDLGRKGFQPELREMAEKISVNIVGRLAGRRDVLKTDAGTVADIGRVRAIHDWIKEQEQHEQSNPLVLLNSNFFLPTKKISIRSEPVSEQDVIVLFNQLVAGGVIRGIRLLATSQVCQYDGIFRYSADEPLANVHFDPDKNPLGVFPEQVLSAYTGKPEILEYKFSLDGLIREFESEEKVEKELELAVFWEMGVEYQRNYTALSLLDFANVRHRVHHGITHILSSSTSSFSAICLKELVEVLNDPAGQQAVQRARYGDQV